MRSCRFRRGAFLLTHHVYAAFCKGAYS